MPFDAAAKESMLDHVAGLVDEVSIHTADPGTGAANEVSGGGYTRLAASWSAASGDDAALAADLTFSGPADGNATWFAVWDAGGGRLGKGQITTGDTTFDSAGEFVLTTGTRLRLSDPA